MSHADQPSLFSPYTLGAVELRNRIVMAAMTRGRATNSGLVPTDLHVEYYRQRATAGLIMTEATWVSRAGIGFINVPGLFTAEQVEGWQRVTDAVHAEGGKIFAQLAHSGSISHPDFFDGELPPAPSAVNPGLRAFTAEGFKDTVTPRAMTLDEIRATVDDYSAAGRNAKAAGFDGVEVHAGTTYLLPKFLNSVLNVRDDDYGGSPENRARIVIEIVDALIADWGEGRVGVKISPTMAMGGFNPTDETVETYDVLVAALDTRPLSHLQVVKAPNDLSATPIAALQDTVHHYRERFAGTLIANFGYDLAKGNASLAEGEADLVSFGKFFISNPDLVRRFAEDIALSPPNPETFYQGDEKGYLDYAMAS
jgi:N-ethylmaleimide reductase